MALALMGVLMPGRSAVGQCDPGWVSGIGVSGLGGQVNAVLALPGGGVVAGGKFNNAGGEAANRVALWNGSAWSALGAGINGSVNALAVLPNGDAVAGGDFSTAGGVSASNIARWNGTSWSALGTGIDGPVYALAVMPNGDLIAGGAFTTAGGVQANSIARWDGLSWSALGAGIEGSVYALAVLPVSGSIVAGGFIASAGGLPVNYVARWDGSLWSPLGVGTNRFILALTSVRTPGGGEDLYAGGFFTQAGGMPANYIARWNGTAWSALGTGTGYVVTALGVLPDGAGGASVIAAGPFGGAGGETVWGVGRWDGSAWFALGGYTDQLIRAISVRPDGVGGGDLYVAGDLAEAGNNFDEPDPVEKIAQYRFGTGLPRVTAQPVGGSRCTGGEATLEVLTGGSGSALSYQWRKGEVPIDTTVNPSAASARLAISNLRSADAGSYDCVIS
ncbi:MAG: hypothetical protein LW822_08340, partial [Phycisphaeraceae bacterium]|nr:hypothetical protein [Phycisphaeraceae bacterium]